MKRTDEEIVKDILEILSKEGINSQQKIVSILSLLLLSIGASLENCDCIASDKILIRYASEQTLGNALMAQAIFMNETWKERKND